MIPVYAKVQGKLQKWQTATDDHAAAIDAVQAELRRTVPDTLRPAAVLALITTPPVVQTEPAPEAA